MSLLSRLRAFLESMTGNDRPEVVATAALLVLVARSDGVLKEREEDEIRALLRSRFDLSDGTAAAALDAAETSGAEVADLVGEIAHGLDANGRRALLAMAYRIAGADGAVQEFEDDFIWRIGHLLGLTDREIEAARQNALVAG
jgi:uncharacterized tellurite resistance protein B-like protein